MVSTLVADPSDASQIVGHKIHWRIIQRYLGKHKEDSISTVAFEPHVQPEDLHWRRAEDLLFELDPELEFWKDRDYVGLMYDGFPVAFNLFDVSFAYSNRETYENRYAYHFRESLWNEIFVRYMGFKNLASQVLEKLDNSSVAPEKLPVKKPKKVPALHKENEKHDLLVRRRLIDAAEGRLDGVVEEFEQVLEVLSKYDKTVTVFGTARKPQEDGISWNAYELSRRLANDGFAVVTGGGYGVMEASNRGAYDAGGASIGLNILLPHEQSLNDYTTDNFQFQHFFGRKVAMTLDSSAFIFFAGGFGTFDELFEILALEETKKIPRAPIILVGSDFWGPVDELIRTLLLERFGTISDDDHKLYRVMDDHDDILRIVSQYEREQNGSKD